MPNGWVWPLTYLRVTDEYGWRIHPIYGDRRLHRGIDLYSKKNDPVYCAAVGVVSWAGYNGGEGNSVHVVHPDGSKTKYFHNTSLLVVKGQQVREGQQLSFSGTTGDSTGVHVHFETHDYANSDSPVNPRDFMNFRGNPFGAASAGGGNYIPIDNQEVDVAISEAEFARIRKENTQGTFDAFLNPGTVNQPTGLLDLIRREADDAAKYNPATGVEGEIYKSLGEKGLLFQEIVGRLDRTIAPGVRGGGLQGFRVEGTSDQWAISVADGVIRKLDGEDREKMVEAGLLRKTYDGLFFGETIVEQEIFDFVVEQANKTRIDNGLDPILTD